MLSCWMAAIFGVERKNKLLMRQLWIYLFVELTLHTAGLQAQQSPQKIAFGALLEEMTDRESLTHKKSDDWIQLQASSYERLSVTPDDPEGWFANHDWNHFDGREVINGRTEFVMLDVDGPGVVTRIWNGGNPSLKAALRFYIDGDTLPVWEADHSGALIGENEMIGYPLSALSVSKDRSLPKESRKLGHNLYAPIPFSKHIKITYEGPVARPGAGDGMFYNINYRLYQADVEMESLTAETINKYVDKLRETNEQLAGLIDKAPKEVKVPEERSVKSKSLDIGGGASSALGFNGAGSIRKILISIYSDSLSLAIKDLAIEISFDGKQTVDAPLGFFFGCGDQLVAVSDWYRKVDTLGNLSCFWVMPFQKEGEVKIINNGDYNINVDLEVATGDYRWNSNSLYFHANYSELRNYQTVPKQGRDYNFITIPASGNYVGDNLQVSKIVPGWWGEGDEKIYIDGSTFPDHFGTGTEDYYGYAWGGQYKDAFNHPFIGQPLGEGNDKKQGGITVNSRVRALDAISFSQSLRFDMESWN